MQTTTVKFKKLDERAVLPTYAHGPEEDAGMDLRAIEETILLPGVPTAVRTGLSIELEPGTEAQIRPRSGLALKHGITIPNSPGTVDRSYRGEVKVILLWGGYEPNAYKWGEEIITVEEYKLRAEKAMSLGLADDGYEEYLYSKPVYRINPNDRIAQMVVAPYLGVRWEESELAESVRSAGGFGSTGY